MNNYQKQILVYLSNCGNQYVTAKELSTQLNVSINTIKNEVASIKRQPQDIGAAIISIPSKGYQLSIIDKMRFSSVLDSFSQGMNKDVNFRLFRHRCG